MAVHEHSLGPLYFAKVQTSEDNFPVHRVGITEMNPPWRRGKALMFPGWSFVGLVVGFWTRTIDKDVEEDFTDDRWFDPKWLDATVDDISTWRIHEEAEEGGA
jgi:hypothetical protein